MLLESSPLRHQASPRSRPQAVRLSRQEGPVPLPEVRPPHRASEDLYLLAEHRVFEFELAEGSAPAEQFKQADEREIGEGQHGPGMLREKHTGR